MAGYELRTNAIEPVRNTVGMARVGGPGYGEANRRTLGFADRWYRQPLAAIPPVRKAHAEKKFSSTSNVSTATRHAVVTAGDLEIIGIPLNAPGGVRA